MCPFEIAYGFVPLTPLDLLPIPLTEKKGMSLDGVKRAEQVKKLHEKVKAQIEAKNAKFAEKANKGRRRVVFHPGDWVWIHLRKERFPEQRKSKLMPRGDGPFQIIERINDNAYKVDLRGEYSVSSTFNVSDLSLFDNTDSRTNPFQDGENDATPLASDTEQSGKAMQIPDGPITRAKAKKLHQQFNSMVQFQSLLFITNPVQEEPEEFKYHCLTIHHHGPAH